MSGPGYTMHVGDTRAVLATMPPGSVDLVLSSPPFLALRSYLPDDDPAKPFEQGSEATPGEFIDSLLGVVEACARVLAPHGTLAFELGDTYCGARGYGSEGSNPLYGERADERWRDARVERRFKKDGDGWPEAKSLCLIPEIFRFALVYGFNPLTGRPTPRWRARNVIRWVRPNPPVGALGDKFRPATSDLLIVCKAKDRYFDLDAVRTPVQHPNQRATRNGKCATDNPEVSGRGLKDYDASMSDGAPPLDWWKISPKSYPGSHYAVWPAELLIRPIKAMCPRRVCLTCGEPARRIVDSVRTLDGEPAELPPLSTTERAGAERDGIGHWRKGTQRTEVGWTDCGHDTWRAGVVLDPYLGSGTTMEVAHGLGRGCVGIDLDRRNVHLVNERMGMWAPEIVDHRPGAAEHEEAV